MNAPLNHKKWGCAVIDTSLIACIINKTDVYRFFICLKQYGFYL